MTELTKPVVVELETQRPIHEVWDAITELKQMHQWFFKEIPEFDAKEGFVTRFNVHAGERDYMHCWKIIEVIPGRKITYNWKYEQYPGDSTVMFELSKSESATTLRLTHTENEPFPRDIPEFTRESCLGGWQYFIQERLKAFLEMSS